jgi:hypothetical protein
MGPGIWIESALASGMVNKQASRQMHFIVYSPYKVAIDTSP